jgi:predicted nucleic acid-binding protein
VTDLLDGNVLVALATPTHIHHESATLWFTGRTVPYATTPITEGTLLRALVRGGGDVAEAVVVLDSIRRHERHRFWPDDLPYDRGMLRLVRGHAGVTDAYLVAMARARGGLVATFDRALAATYPDATELIPAGR